MCIINMNIHTHTLFSVGLTINTGTSTDQPGCPALPWVIRCSRFGGIIEVNGDKMKQLEVS